MRMCPDSCQWKEEQREKLLEIIDDEKLNGMTDDEVFIILGENDQVSIQWFLYFFS